MQVDEVHPEHRIPFDSRARRARNADLAFLGRTAAGTVAVTIEGKADEPFGDTVEGTLAAALERWTKNERSRGIGRVMDLLQSPSAACLRRLAARQTLLRYQLLTAAAGSLAYAAAQCATAAVMVVHEFETSETRAELHARNGADYNAFLLRLGCLPGATLAPGLCGPVMVPGLPLSPRWSLSTSERSRPRFSGSYDSSSSSAASSASSSASTARLSTCTAATRP